MIPIARPDLGSEEIAAVTEVLSSGMVAQGRKVAELEGLWADFVGVRHAMDAMFSQDRFIAADVDAFRLDGVVYHAIKSCRTVSTGLADGRRALMARTGVPSLFLESDMMDKRVVSEAQLKNRIDAFFEGLATRRHAAAS